MQRSTVPVWIAFASLALTCCSRAAVVPDRYPQVKTPAARHRFDVQPPKKAEDNEVVPDLQVGCGDGLLVEATTQADAEHTARKEEFVGKFGKERAKREADAAQRKSRSYFSYTIYTPASVSYSTYFRPQPYKIERPYYIPVFGSQGRLPIYFPPQPIGLNPGFPIDNPPRNPPLQRPTTSTENPLSTKTPTFDRFGPVWDSRPAQPATSTQAPGRPKTSTFPPLVHALEPTSTPTGAQPPPPPSVEENIVEQVPILPTPSAQVAPSTSRPNRCAFAIINCCSGASKRVSNTCFERLGCPGPFWDRSPCESDFAKEAVNYALNYYQ